jgi:hypothetical protein
VSAEAYAQEQFAAALTDPGFMARLRAAGADDPAAVVVFSADVPASEVFARAGTSAVIALHDDDQPHGFAVGHFRGAGQ